MKKISLIALIALLSLGMFSCDIDAPRAFTGTVTLKVINIPKSSEATAMSLFCNLNNWKEDKVNGSDVYVVPVEYTDGKGTAKFVLENYPYAEKFKFQFSPMKDASTKLGSNWWANAISGSSTYANEENNLVYRFPGSTGSSITLVLDLTAIYKNADKLYITGGNRLNTEDYDAAVDVE